MEENQNVDVITSNEEVIVDGENIEYAVVEDENAVHVLPVVDGEIVETPVVEIIPAEEITENVEPAAEDNTDVAELIPPTTLTGVVTATRLNVRELPNKDAKIVTVLNKGDVVVIDNDEEEAHEEFFKIVTCDGLDCYCMKKFIELK